MALKLIMTVTKDQHYLQHNIITYKAILMKIRDKQLLDKILVLT